jgi:hypothetical protein
MNPEVALASLRLAWSPALFFLALAFEIPRDHLPDQRLFGNACGEFIMYCWRPQRRPLIPRKRCLDDCVHEDDTSETYGASTHYILNPVLAGYLPIQ